MPVRPNSQAVTSTRVSMLLRGWLGSKPVTMMVSLFPQSTQKCPYQCQRIEAFVKAGPPQGTQTRRDPRVDDDMAASCATRRVPEGRSDLCGSLQVWPGVCRPGRPRHSPALTPGQQAAPRAALLASVDLAIGQRQHP